jgi:hypothetical protein
MKPIPANGTTGILIPVFVDDNAPKVVFRVYGGSGIDFSYVDYDLKHSDLQVTICDSDAYFYDGLYLDHSPLTLGLKDD